MIKVLMDAEQAKAGDQIQVAGMVYRIVDVEHLASGNLSIQAERPGPEVVGPDLESFVALYIDPEAQFEIIAPDQDGQS